MNNQFMMLFNMISKCKGNPNAMINMLMKQNPNARAILNQMQQSGLTPQQFAEQLGKQNGVDVNSISQAMRNMGIKF